ncbi:hypothetical protein I4F81_008614 [Pyropia yezoensis]|uniref:Uncharacterized protein n=1 Tax=Pyropia yezoensis TaxID=2788 RepID=A0ACC3C810_PYRYE|nr:hypothetical protein I4F81_008614 [Neopyropia yezoensis]
MARVAFLSAGAWTTELVGCARPAAFVGRSASVRRAARSPLSAPSAAAAAAAAAAAGRGGGTRRHLVTASPPLRMGLVDDVTARMKVAMKAKDADTLRVLRNMRAAFLTAEKETGAGTLDDAAAVACLKRLVKQRNQSIEMYEKGGRTDLAESEKFELALIETYLPSTADEATTRAWVEAAIAAVGATKPGDVGKVMGGVMKAHRAEVDGALVKKIAGELLSA